MSIQAVAWVLDHSQSRGFARLVLISIANHANHADECWPAQRTIAREAGISPGSVGPNLRKLVELGELEVLDAGTNRRPARYRMLHRADPNTAPSANPAPGAPPGSAQEMSASARPGLSASARPGPRRTINNRQEPSAAPPEQPSAKPRARTARDDLFDALVTAFGPASTKSRAAFYGKAVRELVEVEAKPEQVMRARREMSRRGWDKPSPEAMLKHWDSLIAAPEGPNNPAAGRFWEEGRG